MPGQEKSFLLYAQNGQIGFKTDNDLVVTVVQNGSTADGKICIGHKILRVNNQVIITKAQFEKAIQEHTGQGVTIVVWHDKDKIKQLKQETKRVGYEIKDITIVWNPISQQKLGLSVKGDGPNGIFICNVPPSSVCSIYLQDGDRVLAIDGWPTVNIEVTKAFLVQAFRYNNRVTLKIERPIEEDAKTVVSNIMTAASNLDPSVVMETDVLDIMERQLKKLEQNDDQKLKCVYKTPGNEAANPVSNDSKKSKKEEKSADNKHVQINKKVEVKPIGMDNSVMAPMLRPVPPRGPNQQQ